ncbi:MAG: FAD-dependent oxidoreductase [Spirochaetia bacterium]
MTHEQKVEDIAETLKRQEPGRPVSLKKKSVSHQVPKKIEPKRRDGKIDISDLNKILSIDPLKKRCTAEPGVTFHDLVAETLKYGLVPIIVPELKGITLGGAVSGCSVESASYRYGGFHDTCLSYEVITASGEIKECRPDGENSLLFQMMHGSFGTLGILSKLQFLVREAKPYVHIRYRHYNTIEEYRRAIEKFYRQGQDDFIDGIIHSEKQFTLCIGNFCSEAPYLHSYTWLKPYYKSTRVRNEDYMEIKNYFFRYDPDCHWIARNYGLENPVLRLLAGKFFLSSEKMLTLARNHPGIFNSGNPQVIVDVFIPFKKITEFLDFYLADISYYPLWVVPYKPSHPYEWLNPEFADDELFIDFAVYGMKPKADIDYYRLIEKKLLEIKGIKTLISHNSYTREEFWKVWNKENYTRVKEYTDPQNIFRNLYEKTSG